MQEPTAFDQFPSPRGQPLTFEYRPNYEDGGTLIQCTDWNTVSSITRHDEYELASLHLSGWALDIGAHIGGCAISLAVDNPDLQVIAVEPVPGNVALLKRNVEHNGLAGRVIVLEAAAASPGQTTETVAWNWQGQDDESEEYRSSIRGHRYIGGSTLAYARPDRPHDEAAAPAVSIGSLLGLIGAERFAFVKIDCEGCEAKFLDDPLVARVDRIHGEYHPSYLTGEGVKALLAVTHDVTFGPPPGPGPFRAVRR